MSQQKPSAIVAAVDFSELGDRTVTEALRLSQGSPNTELHVIAVGNENDGLILLPGDGLRVLAQPEAEAEATKHVAGLVQRYTDSAGKPPSLDKIAVYVTGGYPAERIVALANAVDAEMIIVGTHGRTGLKRIVLGSVAEEVVRRAPCTVLVIRPRDFLDGEKLPDIQPPLKPGEHPLRQFEHRPTYHYVTRSYSDHTMPVA